MHTSGKYHDTKKYINRCIEYYVDSKEFFSWERFFTKVLIEKTKSTYLKYNKSRLNGTYLHEKNKELILKAIKGPYFN
ncbi:MAG: hypothetical protein E6686_09915 [Lachnospiraceae bacterium]|nr:hypothetical protein [Lachnospiraceae bacterium]